jgi:basic membrane protein A
MFNKSFTITRRRLLKASAAGASILAMPGLIGRASAQEKLKVAAIYTVPVEQQWVSRIHLAANAAVERGEIEYVFSENTSNSDYERVMREYSEAGHDLIVGEVFAVEDAAREVARDYPDTAVPDGLVLPAAGRHAEFRRVRQLHPGRVLSLGIIAGAMTKTKNIGMVGGFPIPEVNRLMHAFMAGVREMAPDTTFQVAFIGSWFDPPKAKETAFAHDRCRRGHHVCRALRRLRRGQGEGHPGDRQRDRHPGRLSRHGRRLGAVALRADARCGHRQGQAGAFKAETTASIPS